MRIIVYSSVLNNDILKDKMEKNTNEQIKHMIKQSTKYKTWAERDAFVSGCIEGMKATVNLATDIFSNKENDDLSDEDYIQLVVEKTKNGLS